MNPENNNHNDELPQTSAEKMAAMRARVETSTARVHEIARATEIIAKNSEATTEKPKLSIEREIFILKSSARTKAYRAFDNEPDVLKRAGLINKRVEEINSKNIVSDDIIPNLDNNEIRISDFRREYGLND